MTLHAKSLVLTLAAIVLLTAAVEPVSAAPNEWIWDGTYHPTWYEDGNWTGGIPQVTDDVFIDNWSDAHIDVSAKDALAQVLVVGLDNDGEVVHSHGFLEVTDRLYLSYGAGSTGAYTLTSNETDGGTRPTLDCQDLLVGYGGAGTFTQDAGWVQVDNFQVGANAGTYWLNGGDLTVTSDLVLGNHYNTTGTFIQNGGPVSVGGEVRIGAGTGNSDYYLVNGALEVLGTDGMIIGDASDGLFAMDDGTVDVLGPGGLVVGLAFDGRFVQKDGQVTATGGITIGDLPGTAQGEYEIRDGSLDVSTDAIDVYNGVFKWHGGTVNASVLAVNVNQHLSMGFDFDPYDLATGALFGGTLVGLADAYLEISDGATATHDSDTIAVRNLRVGTYDGPGTYHLEGTGQLDVAHRVYIGGQDSGTFNFNADTATLTTGGGWGIFIGTDGVMNVTGSWTHDSVLRVDANGIFSAAGETVSLESTVNVSTTAQVTIGTLNLPGVVAQTVSQTGGSVEVENLNLDSAGPATPMNYSLSGGNLTVTGTAANNAVITHSGTGHADFATLDNTQTYMFEGGTLDAGTILNSDYIQQNGGTLGHTAPVDLFQNTHIYYLNGGVANVDVFENGTGTSNPMLRVMQTAALNAATLRNRAAGTVHMLSGSPTADIATLRNEGTILLHDDASLTAGSVENDALVGLYGNAAMTADHLDNWGEIYLYGNATLTSAGATLVNNGAVNMGGGGSSPPSGAAAGLDPHFAGHLVNYAYFNYYSGTFEGTYEHRADTGGFYQDDDFTAGGGIINYGTLQNRQWMNLAANGAGFRNFGNLNLLYGTLGGAGVVNEADGTINASGYSTIDTSLTNYGTVQTTDVLTVTGLTTNEGGGRILLSHGERLRPNGGLENRGVIDFWGGGVVEATNPSATFTNMPSGSVALRNGGTITMPLTNYGVITSSSEAFPCIASLTQNHGLISVEDESSLCLTAMGAVFQNSGTILLYGWGWESLTGDDIFNTGTITGAGAIANRILNDGVLRAEMTGGDNDGPPPTTTGRLFLTRDGSTNAGRIEVPAGNEIMFTAGLAASAGTIALSGGTFDNNFRDLANDGRIMGHGTLRADTLTNGAGGTVHLADGDSAVYADVDNAGRIDVTSCTATFYGDVDNTGTIKNTGGTIRILGTYTGGAYISDPADNYFQDVQVTPAGYFQGGAGDRFLVQGDFLSESTNAAQWNTDHADLIFQAGATNDHTLSVTSTLGGGPTGNFAWGGVTLQVGQTVALADASAAPGGTLYASALALESGALLQAGAMNVVTQNVSNAGTIDLVAANMIVDYTGGASPFDQVAAWVASGLNLASGGYWDGDGITSSAAAAMTLTALAVIDNSDPDPKIGGLPDLEGEPAPAESVLVKYTWWGDANLDGVIDSNDYDLIDNTFAQYDPQNPAPPAGGWRWGVGDFTYDGVVDSNDYDKIDNAFKQQTGALGPLPGGPVPTPEPATLALLAAGGLVLLARRRRPAHET